MRKRMISLAVACLMSFSAMPVSLAESYPFVAYATGKTAIYSAVSQQGAIVATMNEGDAAVVSGSIGDYYIVIYEGKRGYILKSAFTTETVVVQESDESVPDDYAVVKNGDRGRTVRAIQEALAELGYYSGEISGYFDSAVFNAVMSFQTNNSLTRSGIADKATQQKLFESTVVNASGKKTKVSIAAPISGVELKNGIRGDAVRDLQKRLTELRYYTGEITGTYDSATVKAVRDFQTANKLTVDGKAGSKTLAKLYSDSAVYGSKSTAAPTSTPDTARADSAQEEPEPAKSIYPYQTVTLASVNLRKKADTSSTRLLTIPKGANVQVVGESGDFLKVVYSGKTGYAMTKYINVPVQTLPEDTSDEDSPYQTLSVGAAGSEVKALQNALVELGYLDHADETYGATTRDAVRAFQNKNKLESTGIADAAVQKLMFEGKPKNAKGTSVTVNALPAPGIHHDASFCHRYILIGGMSLFAVHIPHYLILMPFK